MTTKFQAHQGDVLIIAVPAIPKSAIPVERASDGAVVLAHGESTGHRHVLRGPQVAMFRDDGGGSGGTTYIDVAEPTPVTHEEHRAIDLPAGRYEVRLQCEYSPEAIRQVVD